MRFALAFLLLCARVGAATYYADYATGDDAASGTATNAPWKHCPGDTAATGTCAGTTLVAGDVVMFKSGVRYYGGPVPTFSGTPANPITYRGDWGGGRAILDASRLITNTWVQCASADEVSGNTNYAKIWHTTNAIVLTAYDGLICSNAFLFTAQEPDAADPINFFDNSQVWSVSGSNVTTTTLTDTTHLTEAGDTDWYGAYCAIYIRTSEVGLVPVTNYNALTHTITYDNSAMGSFDPSYETEYYAMQWHPRLITKAGEFCVASNSIYLWPPNDTDPNTLTLRGSYGQALSWCSGGISNLVFQDFIGEGTRGQPGQTASGSAIYFIGGDRITVTNCEFRLLRSWENNAAIRLDDGCPNSVVANCVIHDCFMGRGVQMSGANQTISRLVCSNLTRSPIFWHYASGTISDCLFTNINGSHSDGMAIYDYCTNVTVSRCAIRGSSPFLFRISAIDGPVTVDNCLFDAMGSDEKLGGGDTHLPTTISFLNCTMVGNSDGRTLQMNSTEGSTYVLKNCIVEGGWIGSGTNRVNNIYTSLNWNQDEAHGFILDATESVNTNLTAIFTSPATRDWRLAVESPAIDAGINLSPIGTTDITGAARGATWTIGAYEGGTNAECVAAAIVSDPASVTCLTNATVSFTVTASGTAPLTYAWRMGGTNTVDSAGYYGSATATLWVSNTVPAQSNAQFACWVTNACGSVTSAAAALTVTNGVASPPVTNTAGAVYLFGGKLIRSVGSN